MENTGIFLGLVPLKFQRKPKATMNENSVVNTVAKHFRFFAMVISEADCT